MVEEAEASTKDGGSALGVMLASTGQWHKRNWPLRP